LNILQNRGEGVKKSKLNNLPLSLKFIHGEDIIFGSLLNLQKKAPTSRIRINPTTRVDVNTGKFVFSEQDKRTITKLNTMFENKYEKEDEVMVIEEDYEDLTSI